METITDSKITAEITGYGKKLMPWQTGLAWWVILIEGIALAIIGLLIILDPAKTNIRVGLLLSFGLFIAGLLQTWSLFRNKVPESVDGIVGARAALGIFSGLLVLWLFMGNLLTIEVGLLVLGLGSLFYGLLGLFMVFNSSGSQRTAAFVEMIFFTLFGIVMLYTRYAGPAAIATGVTVVGWLGIVMGAVLILYSFVRKGQQDKGEQAEAAATAAAATVNEQRERVSPPPSTSAAQAAESAKVSRAPAPADTLDDQT
jgi:uncharacterized membrane protein HdeD (DUF308 family)